MRTLIQVNYSLLIEGLDHFLSFFSTEAAEVLPRGNILAPINEVLHLVS